MPKKERKMMPKWSKNDEQIDQQSMRNRSICRKSDFSKTTIIDGVLFENQGSASRISTENRSKINAKSILEKAMPKRCKNDSKTEPKRLEIPPITFQKIYKKQWLQKEPNWPPNPCTMGPYVPRPRPSPPRPPTQ